MKGTLKHVNRVRARGHVYYYHRPTGTPLPRDPDSAEFLARLGELNKQMERPARELGPGNSLNALIAAYKASPDHRDLSKNTRDDYGNYLEFLGAKFGDLDFGRDIDREFVLALRDELSATPRKANYTVAVLSLLMTFAGDRRRQFHLSKEWTNPAAKPKKLKTGDGHRPWEEYEIAAFRKRWGGVSLERVVFEGFLNTGQRGGDIAPMVRPQLQAGEIAVKQNKGGERVWIPVSRDLREVLAPWLKSHKHVVMFPTPRGRSLKVDYMRHLMRAAIREAGLPDDCTLHGLRYTFATRGDEIGLDWRMVEDIVGHRTAEMARKYRDKRRRSKLVIRKLDRATKDQKENGDR